jgi:cytochrome c oxidase subunit 2
MRTQVVVEKPEAFAAWMQQQQVATTQTLDQAIAANPSSPPELTSTEFLAPYSRDMGITPETLHQIHN